VKSAVTVAIMMANYYGGRSPLQTIAAAAALLVAVAIGAHVAWILLAPILPSLLAISIVAMLAYLVLGRWR
jgi:hypothetical protein